MEATLDVWHIAPESAKRVGHPAPFPVDLPGRLHPALHLRRRRRARPVHGIGHDRRRRGAERPPLPRRRDRPELRGPRRAAHRRRRDDVARHGLVHDRRPRRDHLVASRRCWRSPRRTSRHRRVRRRDHLDPLAVRAADGARLPERRHRVLDRRARRGRRATGARRIALMTALFTLGFGTVFTLLGLAASAIGQAVFDNQATLTRVSGVIVMVMALYLAGSQLLMAPRLYPEKRITVTRRFGWATAPILGAAFGFGWSPCLGPVLAADLRCVRGPDVGARRRAARGVLDRDGGVVPRGRAGVRHVGERVGVPAPPPAHASRSCRPRSCSRSACCSRWTGSCG